MTTTFDPPDDPPLNGPPRSDDTGISPALEDFLHELHLRNRATTGDSARPILIRLHRWLQARGVDAIAATTVDLYAYQSYLARDYRSPSGRLLARRTQATHLFVIRGWYRWLEQRQRIAVNPAVPLIIRVPQSRVVVREHLSLQEATALLQTQSRVIADRHEGSHRWAVEVRNLAMLCLALATGRRASGVRDCHLAHIDLERRELRVEREKGRQGRVLPVIGWAIDVLRLYIEQARPLLVKQPVPWLFVGSRGEHGTPILMWYVIRSLMKRTMKENPDLDELPGKQITWHSLRVSFATLLFSNGCDIRSVNELLLHRKLSTTARYTPIHVEDLRQVCRLAHPRA